MIKIEHNGETRKRKRSEYFKPTLEVIEIEGDVIHAKSPEPDERVGTPSGGVVEMYGPS